jgi:NAD(P)-dependent dehydrogenase (short-subunit alcohol dehydrogenase family)
MRFLPLTSKTFKLASAVTLPIALAFVVRRSFTSTMAPSLASLRTSNAEFVGNLQGKPVAVFVGGTSGIGQGMAENFAKWREGRAHIVIVGRNEAAAKDIISHFPQVPASEQGQWTYEFVKCDATLMKEVKRASSEILSRHPKINYLVMSPGYFTTSGRDESEEGIDKKLAVHYYARWKFTEELLPALKAAKAQGEDARVLTVLAAGKGGKIDVNDLGLKTGFSLRAAAEQGVTYNDYLVEVRLPLLHPLLGP